MRHTVLSLSTTVLKYEKARFIVVGAINTFVDFAILLTLSLLLEFPLFLANGISTSCALAVSYLLNKKAVFGSNEPHALRQIILFLVVTLTGLWVLQTAVIVGIAAILHGIVSNLNEGVTLVIGKVIATVVSLTWNYLWYSRVVFRKKVA